MHLSNSRHSPTSLRVGIDLPPLVKSNLLPTYIFTSLVFCSSREHLSLHLSIVGRTMYIYLSFYKIIKY